MIVIVLGGCCKLATSRQLLLLQLAMALLPSVPDLAS
jgi:hypothetical protein